MSDIHEIDKRLSNGGISRTRVLTTGPRGGKTLQMLQAERIRVLDTLKKKVEAMKAGPYAGDLIRGAGQIDACNEILQHIEELR